MRGHVRVRGERGLTLVELLIALALLSFVLLGIAPLFIMSMKSNYSANEYTSINVLARDKLEQLSNLSFTDPRLSIGAHGNDQPPKLPDPKSGIPPASGTPGVVNPYSVTYYVSQYSVPSPDTFTSYTTPLPLTTVTPVVFTSNLVMAAGQAYQFKRVDVTVTSATGPLGIGSRMTRVTGFIDNPAPPANSSVADPCGSGAPPSCTPPPTPVPTPTP